MRRGTILCENVSKRYRLGGLRTLRDRLTSSEAPRTLWALRDLHFRLEPGSTLGIIGPNGAGKTTALRLLAGITRPSAGRLAVVGRTATLIELGAGFHPELSGRENIDLFGLILGMSRRDIRSRLDSIVEFSGLERFLDTPVKRYSSGMYVRLAFSVAAHVEADVLLVDEVLAVGDTSFRQRCIAHMDALSRSGTTLVFVSHNLSQVQRLCESTLLLHDGAVRHLGPTREAIEAYDRLLAESVADSGASIPSEEGTVRIRSVETVGADESSAPLRWNEPLRLRVGYRAEEPISDALVKAWIVRSDGVVCAFSSPYVNGEQSWKLEGEGIVHLSFDPIQLVSGRYRIVVRILDAGDALLATGESRPFLVRGPEMPHQRDKGIFVPRTDWNNETASRSTEPEE